MTRIAYLDKLSGDPSLPMNKKTCEHGNIIDIPNGLSCDYCRTGDRAVTRLLEALEMVRDADDDCHKDGLPTIPQAARAQNDVALGGEYRRALSRESRIHPRTDGKWVFVRDDEIITKRSRSKARIYNREYQRKRRKRLKESGSREILGDV
jgi:hypothetical protein